MIRFANPIFLAGLAAAAVPILIHLLTRDRVRRVAFSSLRFFAGSSRRVLRRKRFSEALLIALRVLVCCLLALLFARPSRAPGGDDAEGAGPPVARARVVAVDVSASMARVTDGVGLQDAVADALADLDAGRDAAALVIFDAAATVVHPLSLDLEAVRTAARGLSPGYGAGDLAAGLRKSDELLRQARAEAREIRLISDLQRSGAESLAGGTVLSAGVDTSVTRIAPGPGFDAAILEADCPESVANDGTPRTVSVRLAVRGENVPEEIPVVLSVNGEEAERRLVRVLPDRPVAVRFRRAFSETGDNPVTVRLDVADMSDRDNTAYFNVRVLPRIPVVVLAGARGGRAGASLLFLRTALAPEEAGPFAVRVVPVSEAVPDDLRDAAVVILADVPGASPALVAALRELGERGGGILALPGASVTPSAYNASLGSVMPCRLDSVIDAGSGGTTMGIGTIDYTHPAFDLFLLPHHGDFGTVGVTRYWGITGSQLSTIPARFDGGRPAIVERPLGKGVSMLWLTPVDPEWNNLPMRAVFLPLLHQTVRYLALRTEERTAYGVGDLLPVPAGGEVHGPEGSGGAGDAPVAAVPGFYEIRAAGGELRRVAVNSAPAEALSETIAEEELSAILGKSRATGSLPEAVAAGSPGFTDRGGWRYVLALLAGLALAELFVANRTIRH